MTEKLIIDPEVEDGNPKKNMHWKIVLLLSAVVLVAMFIKFGGGSTRNTEFKPTPVQPAQLGPAGDPTSIDKGKPKQRSASGWRKHVSKPIESKRKEARGTAGPAGSPGSECRGSKCRSSGYSTFEPCSVGWPAQRRLAASSSWNGRNRIAPGAHCFRS